MSLGACALGPMRFYSGEELLETDSKNLAGKTFIGSKSMLHEYGGPAIGTVFEDSGLTYEVVSTYPA